MQDESTVNYDYIAMFLIWTNVDYQVNYNAGYHGLHVMKPIETGHKPRADIRGATDHDENYEPPQFHTGRSFSRGGSAAGKQGAEGVGAG